MEATARPCPHPLTRAPLADPAQAGQHLHMMPSALQGAAIAVVCRDIRSAALHPAQRLTHFPASPLVCLSWYPDIESGLVTAHGEHGLWRPFGAQVVVSGSQSTPLTSWTPTGGRAGMACFAPDVASALLGVDLHAVHDRFVDAHSALAPEWRPLLQSLLQAPDEAATLQALQALVPRWRALQGPASLREMGRQWVQRVALRAQGWARLHGERHVERRVKAFSGRSLREWQQLVRTEAVFFAARERHEKDEPLAWADLAQDGGFADQAHLIRATRRITGFTPAEFARRFKEDESFWMYRAWV
jgi:hypothetical protein